MNGVSSLTGCPMRSLAKPWAIMLRLNSSALASPNRCMLVPSAITGPSVTGKPTKQAPIASSSTLSNCSSVCVPGIECQPERKALIPFGLMVRLCSETSGLP